MAKQSRRPSPVRYHSGRFPPNDLDWSRLIPVLGPAHSALARFYGRLDELPNPQLLLAPLTTQEAVLSSRIEGTQANLSDVLEFEAGLVREHADQELDNDIEEVLNYRRAISHAVKQLKRLPLCGRLLESTHKVLLSGVRGADKGRGRFRTIQNFIGRTTNIKEASFIPIDPADLRDGISTWERYVNDDAPDRLVQLAVMHAEFESLHPFLDGNGRLGRILIPLFLYHHKLLSTPAFYMSEFLEQHREEYCDRLRNVSSENDWTGWCEFFLEAVRVQAVRNEQRVIRIRGLFDDCKRRLTEELHSQYVLPILDFVFQQITFNTSQFIQQTGISAPTARRNLARLESLEILKLKRPASGQLAAVYTFPMLQEAVESVPKFVDHG